MAGTKELTIREASGATRITSGTPASKAVEVRLRCVTVYDRGTSRQAFDESGPVKRDKGNYSQCKFSFGRRYYADLSAAHNIAARGHVFFQGGQSKPTARMRSQTPTHAPRTPVSLFTLWQQSA